MRPTNYRKGEHHSKAISKGIDKTIDDIARLREYISPPSLGYGLLAFYPMYPESYAVFNRSHLSRLSHTLGRDIEGPSRKIAVGDASFDLYLIRV